MASIEGNAARQVSLHHHHHQQQHQHHAVVVSFRIDGCKPYPYHGSVAWSQPNTKSPGRAEIYQSCVHKPISSLNCPFRLKYLTFMVQGYCSSATGLTTVDAVYRSFLHLPGFRESPKLNKVTLDLTSEQTSRTLRHWGGTEDVNTMEENYWSTEWHLIEFSTRIHEMDYKNLVSSNLSICSSAPSALPLPLASLPCPAFPDPSRTLKLDTPRKFSSGASPRKKHRLHQRPHHYFINA
jgi:hypothetical protein